MKVKSEKENISVSKRTIASIMLITYLSVLSPFSIFAQGAEKVVSAVAERTQKEEKSEVLISAKKGGKVTLGEACIEIPEGALKEDTKISITRLLNVEETGESLYNAIPKSGGYRFLPAGTKFEKEVTITLPYNSILNSKPQSLEDMYTYFYDTEQKSWIKLERLEVNKKECVVRSLTTHFTDMINATLTLPEAASPIDVNLNSIKNLEAAKPDSHLIKFNQPKATNMGDASFSFELGIPAGRKGVQPQISVSYSSGGGNGIMGKGFDINYASSITIDTRLGLPKYDTNDTIMLDGIILEKENPNQISGDIRYKATKETAFSKIVRKNAGTENDCWEVIDKNGTKRIYAQNDMSCVGKGTETFTWNLTKIEDARKNNIIYSYEKDANGYVYPLEIKYTGYGNDEGNYSVKFIYDNDTRKDIRIDARSGKIIACVRLLKSVETHYKSSGDAIRTYTFEYSEGLAKEKILKTLRVNSNADNFYEYTFDYEEPEYDGDNIKYFSDEVKEWNNGKPLQLGNSTSVGNNFTASGGVGYGTRIGDIRATGGGSGANTYGESYTYETLIDINGDGRLDSIKQDGLQLVVCLNTGDGFGSEKPLVIKGNAKFPSDMEYTETHDTTSSWNVYAGASANAVPIAAGVGYSEVRQESTSSTCTSFMDIDRDGLVDIVEAGKNYYLKNLGNLVFEKRNIYSNVQISDVVKALTTDEIDEYKQTYFIQTPFRMFKSPYDGKVTVKETAYHIGEKSGKTINAETYIGDTKIINLQVKDSGTSEESKENIEIKKGDKYYFIADTTDEPKNTDINWNVIFKYTDIRSFNNNLSIPYTQVNDYENISYTRTVDRNHYSGQTSELMVRDLLVKDRLGGEDALADMFSYTKEVSYGTNGGIASYSFIATYNENWKEEITDPKKQIQIYEALNRKGKLYPAVYTKDIFDKYCQSIKYYAPKGSDYNNYITRFVNAFVYDPVNNLYTFRNSKKSNIIKFDNGDELDFFERYSLAETLKKQAFEVYKVNGIMPKFTSSKLCYTHEITDDFTTERGFDKRATLSFGLINVGKYNSKNLYFDTRNKYFVTDYQENGKTVYKEIENYFYDISAGFDEYENYIINFNILKQDDSYESSVELKLEDISYRPFNISKAEYVHFLEDVTAETSPYASRWTRYTKKTTPEEQRIRIDDTSKLFENFELTENQKKRFIEAFYDVAEQTGVDSQGKTVVLYKYYLTKENRDYDAAQEVLDEYKIYYNRNQKVLPYYQSEENPEMYLLNDDYKNWIDFEVLFERFKNQGYTDEECYQKCDEYDQTQMTIERVAGSYECGKFSKITVAQTFNNDYYSKLNDKNYTLDFITDTLELETRTFTVSKDKVEWNSSADFSANNINKETVVATGELTEDGVTEKNYSFVVRNDEYLYGGVDNWFYGVWKGSLKDVPFSESKLKGFQSDLDTMSQEDFNTLKNSSKEKENDYKTEVKNENDDTKETELTTPKKSDREETVHFYLPQVKTDNEYVKDLESLVYINDNCEIDLKDALLGTVAVNSNIQKTEQGRELVKNYYMPFIKGDDIHAERIGGLDFYNIEGINGEVSKSPYSISKTLFNLPSITRSHNEGTDRTPRVSASVGPLSADISVTTNEDGDLTWNAGASVDKVGGSVGTNETTSVSQQMMHDVNGDGIPDIVQVVGNNLVVTYGSLHESENTNEDNSKQYDLCFSEGHKISNINNISRNRTFTTVYGGSVSGLGAAKVNAKTTPLGNIKYTTVEINPSATASANATSSSGTSTQYEGVSDINGDGLPDYFDGTKYRLNTGKAFEDNIQGYYKFSSQEPLSVTSSKSFGTNIGVSLTGGAGGVIGNYNGKNLTESTSLSVGADASGGITYNSSSSNTTKMMMDINGDGLQDILSLSAGGNAIDVQYNTGCSFVPGKSIKLPGWGLRVTNNKNKFNNTQDGNKFNTDLINQIPVLGTALKDSLNESVFNIYGAEAETLSNSLDWNTTVSIGINGAIGANVNIGFDIITPFGYYGTINVTVAGGAGANASTSINGASVKMMDLDGDGLADHVLRIPGVGTYWKRNISGTYYQLKQINLPQGGNVEIKYSEQFGDENNPGFKYVMSEVIINDGCDTNGVLEEVEHGEHSITTKFTYADGYYDRQRKEFMGYKTVTTENPNGTKQIDTYYNRDYYSKGSLEESVSVETASNKLLSKAKVTLWNEPYPLPAVEENWVYEAASGDKAIHTVTTYEYDDETLQNNASLTFGNCTQIVQDFGDGEKLTGKITYTEVENAEYIVGLPKMISVRDKNDNLIRCREGHYNDFGELDELHQYYADDSYIINIIDYDDYGNIKLIKDALDATVTYKYDLNENMFPVEITQSGKNGEKLTGTADYDPRLQTKKWEKDCNGNELTYKYNDPWQRLTDVYTSYDKPNGIPAVHYEYSTPNAELSSDNTRHQQLWYTVTNNKVTFDNDNSKDADKIIQTVVQIDGVGRTARSAKTGYVRGENGWNVSGCVEYDNAGRTVKEYMTEFVPGSSLEKLLSVDIKPSDVTLFTEYSYDTKDRPAMTILPDKSVQTAEFLIENGNLISIAKDPLNNISEQWTDSRGNIVYTERRHEGGNSLTHSRYEYNSMGEMVKAFNAMDMAVTVEYDILGRRTAVESPDSGRQEFVYDKASNIIRETNSVLRKFNKAIEYEYDGLNRLVRTFYPDIGSGTEEVINTYGTEGNTEGAVGKIWKVEDASGTMRYAYGKLGEVVKETRKIKTHLNGPKDYEEAVMEYRSDYLGRMQWIIYPDGEKITYGYDDGGQVVSVKGVSGIHTFNYVNDILYDEYGQRVRIEYGNGTYTDYTYDPARRWLDSIKTQNGDNHTLQNITYKFDLVGNVDSYDNNCIDSVTGNYKTAQKYTYDNLYQLIGVEGTTTYNPHHSDAPDYISTYNQTYNFDDMGLGRMTRKTSKEAVSPQKHIGDNLNYDYDYKYDDKNGQCSYRLVQAGERFYKYDENGNIICEQDGAFEIEDESYHKINQEEDDVYSTDYGWGLFKDDDSNQRITSKRYRRNYTWNTKNQLIASKDSIYKTDYVYGQNGERSNKFTSNSETMYFNKMWILHIDSGNRAYGGQSVKNIYLGETRVVTKLNSVDDPTYNEEYYKQYYYHSDHLGSAALITDYNGREYQRIEYTPYGETWVEKTSNTGLEYLPYKFSAKELDEETGLYYYGARYLDPRYSVWISSDPALGEYVPGIGKATAKEAGNLPGMGGVFNPINFHLYHYAGNNPIKYTDPDGRVIKQSIQILKSTKNKTVSRIYTENEIHITRSQLYEYIGKMNEARYCVKDSKRFIEMFDDKFDKGVTFLSIGDAVGQIFFDSAAFLTPEASLAILFIGIGIDATKSNKYDKIMDQLGKFTKRLTEFQKKYGCDSFDIIMTDVTQVKEYKKNEKVDKVKTEKHLVEIMCRPKNSKTGCSYFLSDVLEIEK